MDTSGWTVLFSALAAGGSLAVLWLAWDSRQREITKTELKVTVREYTPQSKRSADWITSQQELIIENAGPGDATNVRVEGRFPDRAADMPRIIFMTEPQYPPGFIYAGKKRSYGCLCLEELGEGNWEPDGIPFPVELAVKWDEAGSAKHREQTFFVQEPDP